MSATIQTISGSECIGDSLPKINSNFAELAKFVAPAYAFSEISSRVHSVNTTNKEIGRVIYDSTYNRLLVASGSEDTHSWYLVDGSSSITPV